MSDLATMLEQLRGTVLAEAGEALECARLRHYAASSPEENAARLSDLYDVLQTSVRGLNVLPMVKHAEAIARQRHDSGFDLAEVQTAFNVLEEALWRAIASDVPPEDLPVAFRLVSTVLGAGKQALAVQYVSLAWRTGTPALDVEALFTAV